MGRPGQILSTARRLARRLAAMTTTDATTTRTLGRNGLEVPAVGYGAMVLAHGIYGTNDDARSIETLRHAIDAGATFLDSSDAYGAGDNERLIGRAIAGRREQVQVATKWGLTGPAGTSRRVAASYDNEIWVDARPERAREAAEASLRRLGVEAIDLWYLHFPDPAVPIVESVGAMAELVAEGKVRHLGLSNATADQAIEAHRVHPLAAVQAEYSLWTRGPERELLPALSELGVGLVAWGPLGSGFLAGSSEQIGAPGEDFRTNAPRFRPENLAANRDRFAPLAGIAEQLGITRAQLALAWLLRDDSSLPPIVPIPGTRTAARVDENLAAARVALSAETLAQLERIAPPGAAAGEPLLER